MPAGAITLADLRSADWSLKLDAPNMPGSGLGNVVQGIDDVDQCIAIILSTPKGSDVLRPTFGADLWTYIDYPINAAIPGIVREAIEAITLWEPRVQVLSVSAVPDDGGVQGEAHLSVSVTWQLKLGSTAAMGTERKVTTVTLSPYV